MKRKFVLYVAAAAILVTAAGVFADAQAQRAVLQKDDAAATHGQPRTGD